jgi:hypothetical protein
VAAFLCQWTRFLRPAAEIISCRLKSGRFFRSVAFGPPFAKGNSDHDPPPGPSVREVFMEFRWVALIALWTFLSGPVFAGIPVQSTPVAKTAVQKAIK